MKKLFSLLLTWVVGVVTLHAQVLTFSQTRDIDFCSNYSNGADFSGYVTESGQRLMIGDTVFIGWPHGNNLQYSHLYAGKFSIGKALLSPPQKMSNDAQGLSVVIDRIYVYHSKASRKSTMGVFTYVRIPGRPATSSFLTIADLETALKRGEVINPRAPISREEAIAKLKESKDLLDLGIIEQTKYDSLKEALTPLIVNQ